MSKIGDLLKAARCLAGDCAAELHRHVMSAGANNYGDDPCATERAVLNTAQGVNALAQATALAAQLAEDLAQMALMECESNNGP